MAEVGSLYYTFLPYKPSSGAVSDYTKTGTMTIDEMHWTVPGNWYGNGALRLGGKSIENVDREIISQDPMGSAISKIRIAHAGKTADAITLNSVTVTTASDAEFTQNVTTKTVTDFTVAKNTKDTIDVVPATEPWATNSYYKIAFNFTNANGSNYAFVVEKILFYAYASGEGGGEDPQPEPTAQTLYLTLSSDWAGWPAKYAMYYFDEETNGWSDFMTAVEGAENTYVGTIPANYSSVIFVRLNGDAAEANWDNKWSQTVNLTIPADKDLFTVTSGGTGDACDGTWSVYDAGGEDPEPPTPVLANGYYLVGDFAGVAAWAPVAERMFSANPDNEAEMVLANVALAVEDSLKVVYVENDAIVTWYPVDAPNYVVDAAHAGEKDIYFRADGQGGDDWYYHTIYIVANPEPQPVDPAQMYVWNGVGVTSADDAIELGGAAEAVQADGTNIAIGVAQKGNWCIRINKKFDSGKYYAGIAMDNAVNAGDTIKIAYFRTGASSTYVLGMDFSADKASVATTYQILTEGDPQVLESAGTPVDSIFIVPEGVANAKYIRLYRNSGSTGVWIAKFAIAKKSGETPEPQPEPVLANGYYLVGDFAGEAAWAPVAERMFSANPDNEAEMVLANVALAVEDSLKVVYVENDAIVTWYPVDAPNYVVDAAHAGEKAIYFRADGQGGDDWYYHTIYIAENVEPQPEPVLANGYYLVGDFAGVAAWAPVAERMFSANPDNEAEMVLANVALAVEDSLKVVYVENDAIVTWYPVDAPNYVVDAAHAGEKDIYFRADGQGGDDWYYHTIFIAENVVPVADFTQPFTLKFNGTGNSGSDASAAFAADVAAIFDAASAPYVTEVTEATKVYAGRPIADDNSSVKFGTTSAQGTLAFTLAQAIEVDSIVVNATQYGNNASKITVNGTEFDLNAGNKVPQNVKITPAGEISAITIAQSSSERMYLRYVAVYPKQGGVDPQPQPLADGFYLVGTMNEWTPTAEYKFAVNPDNEAEMVLASVTLAENAELKVRQVENGEATAWFPAEAGNYIVDAAHAGLKDIYFRADYQGAEDWYAGCIYIAANSGSALINTEAAKVAVKQLRKGMVIIRRGDREYSIMGQLVK